MVPGCEGGEVVFRYHRGDVHEQGLENEVAFMDKDVLEALNAKVEVEIAEVKNVVGLAGRSVFASGMRKIALPFFTKQNVRRETKTSTEELRFSQ